MPKETDDELSAAIAAHTQATIALTEATQTLNRLLELRAKETAWLTPKEAAQILGVSDRYLLERIRDNRYRYGTHYVNTSDGGRPNYLVSVAAVKKELTKPPEKRRKSPHS
jgi:hypothetical protein